MDAPKSDSTAPGVSVETARIVLEQGFGSLPFHCFSPLPMELFNPDKHLSGMLDACLPEGRFVVEGKVGSEYFSVLPLALAAKQQKHSVLIPRHADCMLLWDKYKMLDNIRAHSTRVAEFAVGLAELVQKQGREISLDAVRAAALLHDLGKTYTIQYRGNHAQLGAAWVMQESGNGLIAQAVLYHVHWPWQDILADCFDDDRLFLCLAIIYADKRVKHDSCVSLQERFRDLRDRYGLNETARLRIDESYQQGLLIERGLSAKLGVPLHEYFIDSGRLVRRA